MDVLKADSLRTMKWHKATRCAKHKIQEVQIIPTPPVSLILVKRSKFLIRSLENASRAYARRRHELCRSLVSSASEKRWGSVATHSRSIRITLTVNGVQSVDGISDEQNASSPHGQRAYLEEAWVHPLGQTTKFVSSPTAKG